MTNRYERITCTLTELFNNKFVIKVQDGYIHKGSIDVLDPALGLKTMEVFNFGKLSEATYFKTKDEAIEVITKLIEDNELDNMLSISIIPLSNLTR